MDARKQTARGNALLEFTLVGIPMVFVLISIFEISRGMWIYHTLAHAVRQGTRFVIVHGQNCEVAPNACQKTVAEIAAVIRNGGVGLLPSDLTVTLSNVAGSTTLSTVGPALLSAHLTNTAVWPTSPGSAPGNDIAIAAIYPFRSALALFWPGAGGGMSAGTFDLPAVSRDRIQF